MRRAFIGMSLGLLAAVAPAVPAAGQSWLPSWAKLTRQKPAAPTADPFASSAAPSYAPNTYSPSPYAPSAYGQAPAGATVQMAGGTNPGGPVFGDPRFGGNSSPAANPAAYQRTTPADMAPPQVNLGTPSPYGALSHPAATSAPVVTTPMPSTIYGAPTVSTASRDPAMPNYTPMSPAAAPVAPAPMTGPGVASSPRLPPVALPGYPGARSGVNYGSMGGQPAPDGSTVFESGPANAQPAVPAYTPSAGPSYGQPSYGQPTYAPPNGQPIGQPTYGQPAYASPYGPSNAAPGGNGACQSYPPFCGPPSQISSCAPSYCLWDQMTAFYEYSAFKGPLDLNGLNGNFGNRVGLFGAIPVYAPLGIAAQLGGSHGWYDWKGTQFTGSGNREQTFLTAGLFQRTSFGLNYGATYDWLLDDYYANFHFEQVRAAVSFNLNLCNEIGVWAAIPTRKDSATIGTPPVNNTFAPVMQGNVYWRKVWNSVATTNAFLGWCEEPNDFSYGSSAQFALNDFVAVNGGFQYIWPGSGGNTGRQEEIWNISFGLVFYPGSARSAATSPFRPLLSMPDNGNFAIRRY